jgi:hypothetical protein
MDAALEHPWNFAVSGTGVLRARSGIMGQKEKYPARQNQCPVSDRIDLYQCVSAVSAEIILVCPGPGNDAGTRERTTR